jgi:hypothetical protein
MTTNRPERRAPSVFKLHYQGGAGRDPLIVMAKYKDNEKKSKKDAQLVLRLNKDLRDRFVDACQDLDTSAAREVRKFIKRFLRRYENGELDD